MLMVLDVLNKLKLVDKFIKVRNTGTPEEFAELLRISKRQLYYYINFLKEHGADIVFDRKANTYLYRNHVKVDAMLSIRIMEDEEMLKCSAGVCYSFTRLNLLRPEKNGN